MLDGKEACLVRQGQGKKAIAFLSLYGLLAYQKLESGFLCIQIQQGKLFVCLVRLGTQKGLFEAIEIIYSNLLGRKIERNNLKPP